MSNALLERGISSAVIIEDDENDAFIAQRFLASLGVEGIVLGEGYRTVDECAEMVVRQGKACVSDNVLTIYNDDVEFFGAELLARLYDVKFPGLLLTSFLDQDSDVSIRQFRERVPSVLDKKHRNAQSIAAGIIECIDEIKIGKAPHRILERNQVWIKRMSNEAGMPVVDVVVPAWDPDEIIRIPRVLISHTGDLQVDDLLFAYVNTGAERKEDLYFVDFERPEVLPGDFIL